MRSRWPVLRWPDNARVALAVIVNLEHWDWEVPPGTPLPVTPNGGPEGLWTGNQPQFPDIGGWGNHDTGSAPQPAMVVLAALLGIGVHFLTALWGLVADHEDGWRYLPLRLGMKIGAARLLVVTSTYLALVTAGILVAGTVVGLET